MDFLMRSSDFKNHARRPLPLAKVMRLLEDVSSPLSAQLFDLCDADLLREALESPEVNSSPNFCYEESCPYPQKLPFDPNINSLANSTVDKYGTMPKTATATATAADMPPNGPVTTAATNNTNNDHLSILFHSSEEIENDISASIDFSPSVPFSLPAYLVNQQDQFDLFQSQNSFPHFTSDPIPPLMGTHQLPSGFERECLSIMPSYARLNANSSTSSSFLEPNTGSYLPSNLTATFSAPDNSRFFNGNLYTGNEMHIQELEFQGDNGGIFCPEPLPRIFHSGELQALSNESQHVMNGVGSSTPLASEVSSLEDSAFKGTTKLSAEERKERIHRYMKKRSERNFSKKIKYACRKTLADSRPRVRGRFAKNDELGETSRGACSNHEEDTDEDSVRVVVKEEEEMVDSSDIFAHISGVNSFKCSYPIQSWI
ncbi:uncharacterized protein LOC131316692 isoform X1 [Rhododendron vialii]|uniref:uncharacterized protein LOC131316692 isoform X1 n=2 Tax=Rhododendron vialii TaxID=182163 RepID=UPI00265DAC7D|nr:uncharacterized protein LOC131316692 isoform X1 [Rhododendron vialii]